MDVTRNFFNKLRSIAVTLEKQTEQLKEVFHDDNSECEGDSPMRYLHELYSEVRTLKGDADNTLCKSSSERDTTYDFIKASKVLMKRNATDLKKISDLFQKYSYKPLADKDAAIKGEAEINPESTMPDQEEPPNLDYPGKSSGSHSPLRIPQLSDFGLSKYALPNTSGTMHPRPEAHAPKEEPSVDGSAYVSPKTERFHIHGRDLCLNDENVGLVEDQTIFLLNKAKKIKHCLSGPAVASVPNKNLATPKQANKLCDYDYMASPAAPAFCTPGVKIPHRKNTALQTSPESNHPVASDHTTEKLLSNTQSLKIESEQMCVSQRPKKDLIKGDVASVLHSDSYPECAEVPSPAIADYSNLFGTPPPPPEITVIPKQIFQILSKYNPNMEAPRSVEKRDPILGVGNKENREYSG